MSNTGTMGDKALARDCECVLREVEARISEIMPIYEGEEPVEVVDGVKSWVIGALAGKSVMISVYVQPESGDPFWID